MRSNLTIFLAGVLAFGMVATGCSKKKDASTAINSPTEPSNQISALAASSPVAASPAPVTAENDTPQIRDLQASVDAYVIIYKRKPASLEQLVQESFLAALPPPPPGKRYAFDSSTARINVVPR